MDTSGDLINFDVIEGQKENIQSLPSGRSAKKLAEIYSPSPLHKLSTPTPTDTRSVNDCIRAEYEAEVQNLSESDDPLDIYDRYVRWTLDAYPSAQATPQSQLHTLLERATKAFISSAQYKNDPRYLKIWVHYIHFFADAPRETFMFLSRHSIGESLALFYEEYAAWLEGAGKWAQAEEVYKLGIEREARPVQRLLRKFKEFEQRLTQQPDAATEPSSPALPAVRPALAAKIDPFGGAARSTDPQQQRPNSGGSTGQAKPAKSKLAVFSDVDAKPSAMSSKETGSKGWDTIGSLADRKKENVVEAKPWVGETLRAGGKKPSAAKMSVFRDPSLAQINNIVVVPSKNQVTVHPQTGKRERIFVNLAEVYPSPEEPGTELSFEEIMAASRGWLDCSWEQDPVDASLVPEPVVLHEISKVSERMTEKLIIHHDPVQLDENGSAVEQPRVPRAAKKKKMMEVNETQIIKAKLDSPSGPKIRKKSTAEPTMTLHTRAATDDIYEIFNAPLKSAGQNEEEESADDDDYETEGDYTTDGESTNTTRHVDVNDRNEEHEEDDAADAKSVSEWSDFSVQKHVPAVEKPEENAWEGEQDNTQASGLNDPGVQETEVGGPGDSEQWEGDNGVETPDMQTSPPKTQTVFVPLQPEDYDPPTRPYRDPVEVANNRLPFMTPITERTECSLDSLTERLEQAKTPCKWDGASTPIHDEETSSLEPLSSPLREIVSAERPKARALAPLVPKAVGVLSKGPPIMDVQCNPVDEEVREVILTNIQPPLAAMRGFYDHRGEDIERGADIRKYTKAMVKASRGSSDRTGPVPTPVMLEFPDVSSAYTVKRELGSGAFAPVYLVENSAPAEEDQDENSPVAAAGMLSVSRRSEAEALKMEAPPTPWEFYMMRLAHSRLGPQDRASASLSYAHELHLYRDEAYLFLPYHPHGTLLDVINFFRAEASGVMDEQLAMFFSIELMRTVEALHTKNFLHGDLKPDNCLLRLDGLPTGNQGHHESSQEPLASQWQRDGSGGWDSRGIVLIDFGRAIDMRSFVPNVQFIADWKTTAQDCAEMREGRPWTWQIDYHGLAGTIHCLLFGKYIETVRCDEGGLGRGGRKYRIRESLKRYWQTELWAECFEVLLNPSSFVDAEEGGQMPVLRSMRAVRERMEDWLEAKSDKGVGLRSLIGRLEAFAKSRK